MIKKKNSARPKEIECEKLEIGDSDLSLHFPLYALSHIVSCLLMTASYFHIWLTIYALHDFSLYVALA